MQISIIICVIRICDKITKTGWFWKSHLIKNFLCCRYDIQYREAGSANWNNLLKETEDTNIYFVDHLLPKTYYIFRLSLIYPQSSVPYIWPLDERFAYESLGKNSSTLEEQRKWYNEQYLCSTPNIVMLIKSWSLRKVFQSVNCHFPLRRLYSI